MCDLGLYIYVSVKVQIPRVFTYKDATLYQELLLPSAGPDG